MENVNETGNDGHRNERPEPKEIVGSTNLQDTILEHGPITGSFSINGVRFSPFKATSPGEVVRLINDKRPGGVSAELDDGFHLVLVSESGRDILVGDGRAYDAYVEQSSAESAHQSPADKFYGLMLKKERGDIPPVLERLGIQDAVDEGEAFGPGSGDDWSPGRSAEDRRAAREEQRDQPNRKNMVLDQRTPFGGANQADEYLRSQNQGQVGGGTTQMNRGPSDTVSDDPNNPSNTSNTIPGRKPVDQRGLSPHQNVQPESRNNPGVESLSTEEST